MECTSPLFYHQKGHITAISQHSFLWLRNRWLAYLSTSQAYGCEVIKQMLDFLKISLFFLKKLYWILCVLRQHHSTPACPLIGVEMFVTSIERSWLLHLCNSLNQDPRSWPEEGGPKRVSWNPWQKAERKVLIHHLHVFEPFSAKKWRPSSVSSGKKSETVPVGFFYLWSRYNFDDTLIESLSSLVSFLYHPVILVASLGNQKRLYSWI